MDSVQISLIQNSFKELGPIADDFVEAFYQELFRLDESLRPLFKGDMKAQRKKLVSALAQVVHGLDKLDTLAPVIQHLGRSHVGYGVKPEHYATVGQALLAVMEYTFGDDWTPELKGAWSEAYSVLSSVMIDAGNAQSEPSAQAS